MTDTDTLTAPTATAIDSFTTLGEAAEIYASDGWRVFPLHDTARGACSCGTDCGKNAGKHPRTTHGFHDATTDLDQVRAWWAATPTANIGIATGEVSGVDVIDIDPEGLHRLDEFDPGAGPRARTPRGHHFYVVHHDGRRNSTGKVATGVDVRGDGGYVVAPPSVVKGQAYRWDALRGPKADPVAVDLPGPAPEPQRPTSPDLVHPSGTPYGTASATNLLEELAASEEGTRNATLFRVRRRLAEIVAAGDLDRGQTVTALVTIAGDIGLEGDEITRTIRSAFDRSKVKADPARLAASILDGLEEPETGGALAEDDGGAGAQGPDPTGLAQANADLGLDGAQAITRFTREQSTPPAYVIHGAQGTGRLTSKAMGRPDALRGAILDATGVQVAAPRPGVTWPAIGSSLVRSVEVVPMGDDATPGGRCRYWIAAYLTRADETLSQALERLPDSVEKAWAMAPYREGDCVYLHAEDIATRLGRTRVVVDASTIRQGLRGLGAEPRTVHVGGSTRSYWEVDIASL